MPIENNIGFSECTGTKQEHFGKLVAMHTTLVSGRWPDEKYVYVDLNAGSGSYNGVNGSPLIFLDAASKCKRGYFEAHLIEKDKSNAEKLQELIQPYITDNIKAHVYNQDNKDFLKTAKQKNIKAKFGLIYTDPNNTDIPVDVLAKICTSTQFKSVEILVYVSATSLKRVRTSSLVKKQPYLKDIITPINKKYWQARTPQGRHQWTFLLGTNWQGFPVLQNQGFVKMNTYMGNRLFGHLNLTKKEFEAISMCGLFNAI